MSSVENHPEKNVIRVQLKQNFALSELSAAQWLELEPMLTVVDCSKGDFLLHQGVHDMEQYFILDGILKRVVSNNEAKEMILRFAAEREMETSYAAWSLKTPTPYSIVCVTKARVAKWPRPEWVAFMNRHQSIKEAFEYDVMSLMSEIMAHTITLHLLAPTVARGLRLPIDFFFRSLAADQHERSIGVILSGMGSDGTTSEPPVSGRPSNAERGSACNRASAVAHCAVIASRAAAYSGSRR